MTAAQAYEMWKSAPDDVKVIDVRTPEDDDVLETRLWQGGTVFWPDSP